MMNAKMKKTLLLAGVAMVAFAGAAWALDQPVDVNAQFRVAISLVKNADIDFTPGMTYLEFSGTPGGGDHVTMGTSGALTGSGVLVATGSGTPGNITVSGDASSTVDVTCTVSATIVNVSGTSSIGVDQIEVAHDTGAAFGGATTCAGLGSSPLSFNLDGSDIVLVGARVGGTALTGSYLSEIYSSTATGGIPATVRVVYQ